MFETFVYVTRDLNIPHHLICFWKWGETKSLQE